jgi:hypothetical protein
METIQADCKTTTETLPHGSIKPSSPVPIVPHQNTNQYGFEVPKDYQHAVCLDEKAGSTKWQDSTKLEMTQLNDYDTFNKDYGHSGKPPNGYKKIRVHLIFAVKHDGRHKKDWLPMDTLPTCQFKVCTLVLFRFTASNCSCSLQKSMDLRPGLQISVTLI